MILQSGKREKKKNEATGQGPRKYRRRGRGMRETTASAAACVTTSTFFFFSLRCCYDMRLSEVLQNWKKRMDVGMGMLCSSFLFF